MDVEPLDVGEVTLGAPVVPVSELLELRDQTSMAVREPESPDGQDRALAGGAALVHEHVRSAVRGREHGAWRVDRAHYDKRIG